MKSKSRSAKDMTKLLFLSKGTDASSTRYRALQYFDLFIETGYTPKHHTISGGLIAFISALWHASRADIVILVRKTFPFPLLWLLRQCSKKLIFDFDDAIFCNSNGSHSKTRMQRFTQTISICDQVFAGNAYLAKTAKQYQAKTAIIPTSVNTNKYDLTPHRDHQQFILVWIGSRSTKKYIAGILPAIEAAATHVPDLTLRIIADFSLSSQTLNIENIQWSESNEAQAIANANIGLAPLPEDNWTKGKCALKVLQYMAAGLPVITSPTSANAEAIENNTTGYYALDTEDWTALIIKAYQEKSTLVKMGAYAKKNVLLNYHISTVFEKVRSLLNQL